MDCDSQQRCGGDGDLPPPESSRNSHLRFCLLLMAAIVIAYLPLLLWNQWPTRDLANRYAPMADAFARGDFRHAFHPRCQSLHTTAAGLIAAATGCGGFLACKLSALLFFALSALPLFRIFRMVFDGKTARWALVLFAGCACLVPPLVMEGCRDAAKMFVQTLLVCGFFQIRFDREKISGYVWLGTAAGLCVCTRGDLLLVALIFLLLGGVLDRRAHLWIWRSLLAAGCFAAFYIWESFLNFYISGAVVPEARFYAIFRELFRTEPTWNALLWRGGMPGFLFFVAAVYGIELMLRRKVGRAALAVAGLAAVGVVCFFAVKLGSREPENISRFLSAIAGGMAPPFLAAAAIGVLFRCCTGKWSRAETWLLAIFFLLDFLVIAQILVHDRYLYVSSRYLLPSVPLFLGWSFIGAEGLWRCLLLYAGFLRRKWVLVVLLGALTVFSLFCTYRSELVRRIRPKDRMYWSAIREIESRLSAEPSSVCPRPFSLRHYQSDMRPFVYFDCESRLNTAAFLAGGSAVGDREIMDFLVSDSEKTEKALRRLCPRGGGLTRYKAPIRFGDKYLQIWKVER